MSPLLPVIIPLRTKALAAKKRDFLRISISFSTNIYFHYIYLQKLFSDIVAVPSSLL